MVESTQAHEGHATQVADRDVATVHDGTPAHGHEPNNAGYVRVFIALAVLTSIEVMLYYFDLNERVLIGGLLILAAMKFALVVAFFMHLRFDNRIFLVFFAGGLAVAAAAFVAVLAMFRAL